MNFKKICSEVLNSNPKIRFTGILNSRGDLVAHKNRSNSPLLSDNEVKMAIHYTFDRWTSLQNLEFKLGKEQESITNYENVTTISIALDKDLFLLSLEPGSNYRKIISDVRKILEPKLKNKSKTTGSKVKIKMTSTKKKIPKKSQSAKTKKPSSIRPSRHTPNELRIRLEQLEKRLDKVSSKI